jgi:hypothetical protein
VCGALGELAHLGSVAPGSAAVKPLPKAPLTEEDRMIIESRWHYLSGRERIHPLWYVQYESDRHDYELMRWAQRHREYQEVIPVADDPLDPYRVHIRGPVQWLELFDIT